MKPISVDSEKEKIEDKNKNEKEKKPTKDTTVLENGILPYAGMKSFIVLAIIIITVSISIVLKLKNDKYKGI